MTITRKANSLSLLADTLSGGFFAHCPLRTVRRKPVSPSIHCRTLCPKLSGHPVQDTKWTLLPLYEPVQVMGTIFDCGQELNGGMAKTFRDWVPEQNQLMPPSVLDWVPAGHLVHFVLSLVREQLNLEGIFGKYAEERGYPPFHPGMMVGLLLYAYSQGIYSSRRIAKGCEERVDFMALTGMQHPDF